MKSNELLKGITIVDFSNRLPGPLSTNFLSNRGANVIKIEDKNQGDPFNLTFHLDDTSFKAWYKEFNDDKKILKFDFEHDQEKLRNIMINSDCIIIPKHAGFQKKIGISLKEFKNYKMTIVEFGASRDSKTPLHDLNALAVTGLLSYYLKDKKDLIVDPPFVPVAGICFAQQQALDIVSAIYKSKTSKSFVSTEVYLMDCLEEVFGFFIRSIIRNPNKYLHNGLYPCYSIYRLKDGHYLAVAAVEEKFWTKFCEIFQLGKLSAFEGKSFDIISKKISETRTRDARDILEGYDICVNVI